MRVISGTLKGRTIKGYDIEGTRPTMDRVKESLFGIIQNNLKDSICLDLFCGSGNLGIEAISNGSKLCYFVDNNPKAIKVTQDNLTNFNIKNNAKLLNFDYKKSLKYFNENNIKFDLIFVDPPYDYNVYEKILEKLIIDNPSILRRPIIVEDNKLQVGYNEEDIRVFIPAELRKILMKLDCDACDYKDALKKYYYDQVKN